jgi:hypothetical protein
MQTNPIPQFLSVSIILSTPCMLSASKFHLLSTSGSLLAAIKQKDKDTPQYYFT